MPWRFVDYWKMTHDPDLDLYRQTLRAENLTAGIPDRRSASLSIPGETH